MPHAKLTKTVCDRAKHDGRSNQTLYRDSGHHDCVPGLALRVTASGHKSFILEYRDATGRKRRMTLERYGRWTVEQARTQAKQKLYGLAQGLDPIQERERQRKGDTLADVAQRYLDDLKARAKAGAKRGRLSGWESAKGLWERHGEAALGRRRVSEVTVEDVRRPIKRLGDGGKAPTADHLRTLLHAIFETARGEGLRGDNPVGPIRRYDRPPQRRRAVTLDELKRLGEVLRKCEESGELDGKRLPREACTALRLLAMTGMRKSELVGHVAKPRRGPREGLRWGDVDLEGATYTLAAVGGGSGGKGGAPRTLPLGKLVVELLGEIRPEAADEDPELLVIGTPGKPGEQWTGLDRCRKRLYEAAGLEGVDGHSLRHLFETVSFQAAPAYAGALTGRALTSNAVLNSYLHVDLDGLREVADRVAARIAAALDGRLADVLPFERPEHEGSTG